MRIEIKSQNKELLSVLNKNPNTDLGLYLRPLRNGHIVGNCVSENEYEIIFQDTKHSYTNYEDNQIDFKSYCSPEVVLGIIRELFSHLVKPIKEVSDTEIGWLKSTIGQTDNKPCTITVNNFMIGKNWYRDSSFLLCRYIPEISVEETTGHGIYRLSIQASSIVESINLLGVVSFMCAVSNDDNFFIDHGQVEKYATILTNTPNTPYFIYYLFIKRCCLSPKVFESIAPKFETAFDGNIMFTPNDTHRDRMIFVRDHLNMDRPVLNFGCGEFKHERFFGKKFNSKLVSYDIDDYSELHQKFKERFTFDWEFTTDLSTVDSSVEYQLVLSEVIEHCYPEKIIKELFDILDYFKISKIIITTPNVNFNKHYNMDTEFRRDDHVFEFNPQQFKDFCGKIGKGEFYDIGDRVNEDCVTLGFVAEYEKE